jgi:single-stranded-DNA-specific exonuclease
MNDLIDYIENQMKEKKEYSDTYKKEECSIFSNKEFYTVLDKIINKTIQYNKILVYTDFDSDGMNSALIIREVLLHFNIPHIIKIGNRRDGYGIHYKAIEQITKEHNTDILITADAGITNKISIEETQKKLYYKYIFVTDHHNIREQDCPNGDNIFIINNKYQQNIDYHICGAGLVYVIFKKYFCNYSMTVFAGQASVGDMVNINYSSYSRKIIKDSLYILNNNKKELKEENILLYTFLKEIIYNFETKIITEMDYGFSTCPSINSLSRLNNETLLIEYFNSDNITKAKKILKKIKDNNEIRKIKQQENEENIINSNIVFDTNKMNIIISDITEKSMCGLLSSFILNKYKCDNIVLTTYNNTYAGSARTIHINLIPFLDGIKEVFSSYGSHENAGGITLKDKDSLNKLKEYCNIYILNKKDIIDNIFDIDYDTLMSDELLEDLNELSPFGMNNKPIQFRLKNLIIINVKKVKSHIFCMAEIANNNSFESKIIELLLFKNYSNDIKVGKTIEYVEGTLTNDRNFIVNSYNIKK